MYVIEFVPDGWANDAIRLEHGSHRDLEKALSSVPEGCIPAKAEEMIAMVEKD